MASDIAKDIPEPGERWTLDSNPGEVLVTQVIDDKTHYTRDSGTGGPGSMPTRMFMYYYSKVVT